MTSFQTLTSAAVLTNHEVNEDDSIDDASEVEEDEIDDHDEDEDEDDDDEDDDDDSESMDHTEMKEQMYQDKLAELKSQLAQLQEGSLPDYDRKLRKLEAIYRDRIRVNDIIRDLEVEMVEQEFINEKKSAAREFEEHKVFLREQLIAELEEKQKMIETERHNMELTSDPMDIKPMPTRKLRRRQNESSSNVSGYAEKRRKAVPVQMNYALNDSEIHDDLKIINKNRAYSSHAHHRSNNYHYNQQQQHHNNGNSNGDLNNSYHGQDIRVDDGKLFYHRRWFRRGQTVQVEPKNGEKYSGVISAINTEIVWVRRAADNTKVRVYINQLAKGKVVLKRRAS